MTEQLWSAVDQYFINLFLPSDPILDWVLKSSTSAGLPEIQVAPNQGKLLFLLAQIRQARKILEIGTLGGYSTIWLARALPKDGKLITLECVPTHAQVATDNIARAGLVDVVEVRLGPALESLAELKSQNDGPFDLIFIDADKESYPDYLLWSLQLSGPGTLIIADNTVRDGEVINSSSLDPRVQGVRRFNELLAAQPHVTATAIQTVGGKGYDGIVLALVTKE